VAVRIYLIVCVIFKHHVYVYATFLV